MTPLRAKYIGDLVIHGRSKNTQKAYTRCVYDLARYYRRSPELISYEEVTGWLHHLIKERQLSASSVNIAVREVLQLCRSDLLGWFDAPAHAFGFGSFQVTAIRTGGHPAGGWLVLAFFTVVP